MRRAKRPRRNRRKRVHWPPAQGRSSVGRAAVSKTVGRGFESFAPASRGVGSAARNSRETRVDRGALRGDLRGARVACPGALQHRRRRLRQAPARQARDGLRALRRRVARAARGASCRISRTRPRNLLAAHGVERGDRVAVVLPPTPETAAIFFGTWKLGAILLSMSVLYGDEGIAPPAPRLRADACSSPTRRTRRASTDSSVPVLVLDADAARRDSDRVRDGRHGGRRSRPALLHLGHDRAREGDRPRPPLPPRPRGVRLLPRGPGRRALPRHGRVGVGGRDRAAARAVAPRRRAVRLPARGRLRPAPAARLPLAPPA